MFLPQSQYPVAWRLVPRLGTIKRYSEYSSIEKDPKEKYRDAIMNSNRNEVLQLENRENPTMGRDGPDTVYQQHKEIDQLVSSDEKPEES